MSDDHEYTAEDLHQRQPDGRGRRRELTTFWKVFAFFIGCVAMALVVGVLFIMLQAADTTKAIRSTQNTNTHLNTTNAQLLRKVAHLSHRIQSCTTPGDACHNRGQRQLAETVTGLTDVAQQSAAASAACAANPTISKIRDDNHRYLAIYQCELLALHHPGKP